MIIVRNCFVAKPGHASKLAAQLKEAAAAIPKYRVLTDLTGDFNRVIAAASSFCSRLIRASWESHR